MPGDPRAGLAALRIAAEAGVLASLCLRYGVRLLVVFGSVLDESRKARDLDIAVAIRHGVAADVLGLIDALARVSGTEAIDLMDLRRAGPVARERALVGTLPLFESDPGTFANAQMAAMLERIETDWLRRLDLELMSG